MLLKSKVIIKGAQKDGYIILIEDKQGSWDIAITHEELQALYRLLKKNLTFKNK
jgi:hypothetical protein